MSYDLVDRDDYEYLPMYEETEGLEEFMAEDIPTHEETAGLEPQLFHIDAETLAQWVEVARSEFPSPVVLRVTDHGASLWCGNIKALRLHK